jgi:hypothetical protein
MIIILILLYIIFLYYTLKEFFIEIKIYDQTNNSNIIGGYNLGDLLNMPYYFAGWTNNPHQAYNLYKEATPSFPNSILYYYSTLRTDENEPIPNLQKIIDAIDMYINNNIDKLDNIINKVNDPNVLCIHLRSGDKGIIEDDFVNKINYLSSKYSKIIILTGVHSDQRFNNIENSKNNTIESINKLNNNDKIEINLEDADIHLCIMHKCKNLLLHKGGFSVLGSILFTGDNLYATDLFQYNQELLDSINSKIQFI